MPSLTNCVSTAVRPKSILQVQKFLQFGLRARLIGQRSHGASTLPWLFRAWSQNVVDNRSNLH
jgi:hypothetical protein